MLILFSPVLLIVTALSLGLLRLMRRRFRLMWLVSFGAACVAWISVLLWQLQLPISLVLPGWGSEVALPIPLDFSANTLSWCSAFSVVGLLAAGLLIAPARRDSIDSTGWTLSLAFSGLALLAIAANNLPTIVLAWAALDLAEVSLALHRPEDANPSSGPLTAFLVRTASLALVLLAFVLGSASENAASYAPLLLAAVALRLLALAAHLPSRSADYLQNGTGIVMPLASAAATLSLLSHIEFAGKVSPFLGLLILFSAGLALYSGWMWLRASDELAGRAFWVLGVSGLAMGAAVQANPVGATGWGISLVLAGGTLFWSAARQTRLKHAVLIGAWSLSALPFSISATAWTQQAGESVWALPPFVLAQALLLAGYVRHATRAPVGPTLNSQPAWMPGVFDSGLAFLVAIQVVLGLWGWDGARQAQSWPFGLLATALGLGIFWGESRLALAAPASTGRLQEAAGVLGSLVRAMLRGAHNTVQQLLSGVTRFLEGEAGIMWGLLLLALLVSLIVSGTP